MTRTLRQRHRWMVLSLGVLVPAAFSFGIATREMVPALDPVPFGLSSGSHSFMKVWSKGDLWAKMRIVTTLMSDSQSGSLAVQLTAPHPILRPDVILYWCRAAQPSRPLPGDAILLGSVDLSSPDPLLLPKTATESPGQLLLYSLADNEIFAVSKTVSLSN